jgi:MFS family permease
VLTSSVTTALPTIGQVFNRSDIAPWIGTSYLLTSTLMQPIYGRVSDIFGRKIVLLFSQVTFLIGALASSQAQSMIQLIVFRAIQGIGGGGILNLSMIIISDVVSLKDRGKYQGISGCVMAAAMSAGPIIGGVFTESIGWRWCFYITLPISGVSIIIVIFLLPLKRVKGGILKKLRMLDWWGSVLTIAWSILVLLAFSFAGSTYGWKSPAVIAPLVIGIMLLGVWLYVEARVVALPLVPLRIFRIMTVSAMMTTTLFSGMVFYATLYYLPTYYQVVRGESAIRSGVLLLPLVTVQTVTSFVTGFVQSKTGDYWWALTIGFAMWSIGLGLLSTINETTPTAHLIGFQIIDGIGAGQTFQTSLVAIQAAVERKDMAVATGMRNFMRMLGGTLALTICSTIINNLFRGRLSSAGLDADLVNRVVADPTAAVRDAIDTASRLQVTHAYGEYPSFRQLRV